VFVVWMAIADAFAVNPAKAFWSNFERMDGWVTLIHVFLFFLITGSIFAADRLWRKWWLTFLAISAVVCAYGLLQLAHVFAVHQGGVRLDATFGNSDYLACYMLFAIAISLWQAFETKVKDGAFNWLRYALFVLTAFEVYILFQTATRGAILGFLGAIGLGAVLWMLESGKKGRQMAGLGLVGLLVIIGGFFLVRNTPIIQNDPSLSRLASISLSDPETHTRLTIWHMALEGFMAKPVTGWGQDGFNYVFNQYYEPQLEGQEPWFDRAHNMYLDWLVAGGFPALLLFTALLASAVVALYRSNISRTERIMLLSALAAYCFQGLFVFDNLFSYIPFVAILAIAHGGVSRPIAKLDKVPLLGATDFMTYAVPIGAVALVIIICMVNVPGIRAGSDIITAITPSSDPVGININAFKQAYADGSFANQEITEQLLSYAETTVSDQQVSAADKQTVYTYALQQGQALITAIPKDARIRLEYALALRAGGNYAQALAQIAVAEQLSPNKQGILTEQGIEEWQSGNMQAAADAFNKAYQLDPTFSDIATYAAAGDIITNQIPAGKALLQQYFGTTTVDQDVVLLAYYQVKDFPDLIAVWNQRVIDQSNSASAELGLAAALADAGQIPAARAEIQKAIADHPDAAAEGASMLSQLPGGK
jgi:O-antigen ligase/tetratricopeptide (TPR) repeat protein